MIKWYILSSFTIVALCLTVFQNCAGGAVPAAVKFGTVSSASVAYVAAACALDNTLIPSGTVESSIYSVKEVAAGSVCPASVSMICNAGVWNEVDSDPTITHQLAYSSCVAEAGCTFGNESVVPGGHANAYSASTVAMGSSCSSVETTLTCQNGSMVKADGSPAGTYIYTSCSVNTTHVNEQNEPVGAYAYNGNVRTASNQNPTSLEIPYCGSEAPVSCESVGQVCFVAGDVQLLGSFNLYRTYRCETY